MPYVDTGRISLFFEDAGSGGVPALLLHELGGTAATPPLPGRWQFTTKDARIKLRKFYPTMEG